MIVTVDINVLLDVFEKRQPHFVESARVVSLVTAGVLTGVVPAHGLTTIYYLVRSTPRSPRPRLRWSVWWRIFRSAT